MKKTTDRKLVEGISDLQNLISNLQHIRVGLIKKTEGSTISHMECQFIIAEINNINHLIKRSQKAIKKLNKELENY